MNKKPYDKYVDLVVSEILKFYTPDKEKGWMRSKKAPRIFFETIRGSKYPEWSLPSYKVENEMTKAIEDYVDKAAIPEGADFITLEEQRLYQEINNKLWDMTHPSSIVTEDNNNDGGSWKGRGALTAYYQVWAKGPTDSKAQFQDEFKYMNDLIKYVKNEMTEGKQVRVLMVWEDEDGNIVDRDGEILLYDDGMIKDLDHFLFGVMGPQETADMFGKKVYHPKKDKIYVPQRDEDEEINFQEDLVNTEAPIEYKGFIIDKNEAGGWIVKYPDGAHLFEYRPDMPLSQVKADLTRSINKGEVNSTLIKEEYGYYRGTIPCDVIGEQLEYNSWSGYVDDEEWTLDINGFHQEDFFTMDVADYMANDIAYPVKDGHLNYMGLDIIMYQDWLANTSADVDSIKHDLMLLCDDTDAINKFLAGEVEELEFWVDYDVNFDMEAWEDSFYSDDEEDEEELEEV